MENVVLWGEPHVGILAFPIRQQEEGSPVPSPLSYLLLFHTF